MKIAQILLKNFKLLLRSKITALVVVLGPLFIILLVGLAFNNNLTSQFRIGVFQNTPTPLAESFIDQLENNSFEIVRLDSEEECLNSIRQSALQACLVFPEDFELAEDKTNEVKVYADYSRTNFVYYLVELVSSNIQATSSELSLDLTKKVLDALADAKEKNQQANLDLVKVKTDLESAQSSIDSVSSKLNSLDVASENVDITNVVSDLEGLKSNVNSLKTKGVNAIASAVDAGEAALDNYPDLEDWDSNSTYQILIEASERNDSNLLDTYNGTVNAIDDIIFKVDSSTKQVKDMIDRLDKVKTFKSTGTSDLNNVKSSLESIKTSVTSIKSNLESVNQNIESVQIKKAESIVSPITTKVEPVVTESTNITYMFPYLIILIIMFVCLMLSSTIIIMEKKSKAYFRNFTTPTNDMVFMLATYLTNLIVVLLQVVVLLVLAYFLLNIPVFSSAGWIALLFLIVITLFTAIGMCIGYWFSSQEAAIILAMSIGSLLLLVSNLILPLELMPAYVQMLAQYNPYVMLSELLRQLVIFNVVSETWYINLGLMAGVALVIVIILIIVQKVAKITYFKKLPHTIKKKEKKHKAIHLKSFKLYERSITNEFDLLNELKKMDDETFKTYVNKDKNDFYNWAKYVLKDKSLAAKLKTKSRVEMMKKLENKE